MLHTPPQKRKEKKPKKATQGHSPTATHTSVIYLVRQGEYTETQRGLVSCPGSHSHGNFAEKGIQSRLQVQCSAETPGPFSWTIWLTCRKACLWTSLGRKPGSRQVSARLPAGSHFILTTVSQGRSTFDR